MAQMTAEDIERQMNDLAQETSRLEVGECKAKEAIEAYFAGRREALRERYAMLAGELEKARQAPSP